MNTHTDLAAHLCWSLRGGHAHCGVNAAFGGVVEERAGDTHGGFPHSLWQLLEHLPICQRDLIEYSTTPGHVSPDFPDGLWPDAAAPPGVGAYDAALAAFLTDREELCGLIETRDLLAPLPNQPDGGETHTLLRTATIALDHQAYHAGQAVMLRKAMGCWPG